MLQRATPGRIFLAPAPRAVADIFDSDDLAQLRALGDLIVHEAGPVGDELFSSIAADTEIVIGQIDLPESRLNQACSLRAIFNSKEISYPMSTTDIASTMAFGSSASVPYSLNPLPRPRWVWPSIWPVVLPALIVIFVKASRSTGSQPIVKRFPFFVRMWASSALAI